MVDYDGSYELQKKLVYYYGDHAMGWACLGDIQVYKKNYSEAEKAYRQALVLKPDTECAVSGLRTLASLQMGFTSPHENHLPAK